MAAASFMVPPSRRRKSPITFGRVLAVVGVGLVIAVAYNMLTWQAVSDRPNEMKTTAVILPPPPPPPPPPPKEQVEQPPEPTIAPPIEQPLDTPPPPDANNDPVPGDNALTAREGAGPSNYGLGRGDGSGTQIGGRPGGTAGGFGGFNRAAYASYLQGEIKRAIEADRELKSTTLRASVRLWIDTAGRIVRVEIANSDKVAAIREALVGRSVRPPDSSLAMPVSLSLDIRRGG